MSKTDLELSERLRKLAPKHESPWMGPERDPKASTKMAAVVMVPPMTLRMLADEVQAMEAEIVGVRYQAGEWRRLVLEWQDHIDSIACAIAFDFGRGAA